MSKNENKTQPTQASPVAVLEALDDEKKKEDSFTLLKLIEEQTGYEPVMWGDSIIGYGKYHYKYQSGRTGEFMITGFAPRKRNLTIYIMPGFDQYDSLMQELGKFKTGRSCLYVNKLADIDLEVLRTLISKSVDYMRQKYETE